MLAEEAVSILLVMLPEPQCPHVPGDHRGVREDRALLHCVSWLQLGYEPHPEAFRGGVTSFPNALGNSSSLSTSQFALPEKSPEGRGGLGMGWWVFSRKLERHQEVGTFLSGTFSKPVAPAGSSVKLGIFVCMFFCWRKSLIELIESKIWQF